MPNPDLTVPSSSQSGNILFLILIAVALFAALSYAVTQSTRSGGGNARDESMSTAFGQIQNAILAHRGAYQRMAIAGIDPETGIEDYWLGSGLASDAYDRYDVDETGTTCATSSCRLYSADGGGITPFDFAERSPYGQFTADYSRFHMRKSAWTNEGTTRQDLVYVGEVKRDFCIYFNQRLGMTVDVDDPANVSNVTLDPANGVDLGITAHSAAIGTNGRAQLLGGQDMGCAKSSFGDWYFIVALIYPR